jgi:hypothetical protein
MRIARVAVCIIAMVLTARGAYAQADPRSSVLEIEWRTPTGYDRCAAIVTARRPQGLEAKTAAHCATQPYTIVRFFDGHVVYGSAVHVVSVSETVDEATLFVATDVARVSATPVAHPSRGAPAMGTTLTIVGHPTSALRAPNEGRWTVQYGRMGEIGQNPETGTAQYEVYCARCGPGDSGSGVFDPQGRLIGMIYGVTEIDNVAGGRLPDGQYADVIPVSALR